MRPMMVWIAVVCGGLSVSAVNAGDPIGGRKAMPYSPGQWVAPTGTDPLLNPPPTLVGSSYSPSEHRSPKKEQIKANVRQKITTHRCEPDGCPTPLGCGNVWSEFKFVFGSCRQFFGNDEATEGCLHKTTVPSTRGDRLSNR